MRFCHPEAQQVRFFAPAESKDLRLAGAPAGAQGLDFETWEATARRNELRAVISANSLTHCESLTTSMHFHSNLGI